MKNATNKHYENLKISMCPVALFHQLAVNGKVSGSIFAVGEIKNAIVIVHGACGCAYHYRYSARTRHYPNFEVVTSDLCNTDIVYSGEDKLLETIIETHNTYKPDVIVIVPTPVCDIIQDDVTAVAQRAFELHGIKVIVSRSELFSHRDKTFAARKLQQLSKQKFNKATNIDFDIMGCGYTETLYGLVEQAMKPQEVIPYTVNIETIAWGVQGNQTLKDIEATLNEVGVIVNSYFPTASITQIETMPRVQLNLVRRLRWATRMKEIFGTPFLQLNSVGKYNGFEGIVNFYTDIGEALDIPDKMQEMLQYRKQASLEKTSSMKNELNSYNVFVITRGLSALPYLLKNYKETFNINVIGCAVIVTEHSRHSHKITDEVLDNLMSKVNESLSLYFPDIKVTINPTLDELKKQTVNADLILGTENFYFENLGIPLINPTHEEIELTFESYESSVKQMHNQFKNAKNHNSLILNKLNFDLENYPLLNEDSLLASKNMWQEMWLNRGDF